MVPQVTRREMKAALKASDVVMTALGCKRLKDGLAFFEKADENHDGELTLAELTAYVEKLEASVDHDEENRAKGIASDADMKLIEEAFNKFDKQHTGSINFEDLRQVYCDISAAKGKPEVGSKQSKHWVEKVLRKFDEDHDGQISFDEFVPMCLRGPFHEIFDK